MAAAKTLYVELKAGVGQYVAGMKVAADATAGVGRSAAGVGRDLEKLAAASSQTRNVLASVELVAGGALVAGLGYGVGKAIELERSLYNVATISDDVRANMGQTSAALIEMSTRLPQSANELAQGLYDVVSSGFQAKDAMLVLDAAAIGASAGLSTTATSARALTAILNAYGLGASSAADVNDILFQTVNKGVVTYDELSSVIGNFVGTAAAAKVPIDDAASALAAMTLTGLDAAEASTSLNNVMQKIIDPSDAMAGAIQKAGYESGSAALETLGLHGTIELLSKSMGTSTDVALKLFPEIRAARGYLALTSAEGKNYASTFDSIADKTSRAQAAQKALEVQSQSAAFQFGVLRNQATGFAIGLGQALLPAVHAALVAGQAFLGLLNAMPGPMQTALAVVALLGGGVLVAGGAFLKAKPTIDTFRATLALMRAEGSAVPGVLRGVSLAAGVLGVALVAATVVYSAYAGQKAKVKAATDELTASLKAEREGTAGAGDQTLVDQIVKSGDIDRLKDAGIAVDDYVAAIKAGPEAMNRLVGGVKSDLSILGLGMSSSDKLAQSGGRLASAYAAASKTVKDGAVATKQVAGAAAAASPKIAGLASMTEKAADGTEKLSDAQKDLQKQLAGMGDAVGAWGRAMDDVKPDALKALAKDSKKQTDSVKSGLKSLAPTARTSLAAFTLELAKGLADQRAYAANLAALTRRGRADLVEEFIKMGAEGPKAAAAAVKGTDAELGKLAGVMRSRSALAGAALSNGLDILAVIAAAGGTATVASLAAAFTKGDLTSMRLKLQEIRNDVNDIPTQHTIDVLLGKVPGPIVIPISYSVRARPNVPDQAKSYFAEGGILRSYAAGGVEPHVAQVGNGRMTRVWNEPETGGEAYIPLHPSKRARSAAVLDVVARQFGQQVVPMADGGVLGGSGSRRRSEPLIGQLIVQPKTMSASPAEMFREAFFQAHLVAKAGGRG
jgi:TP901 family phage tail tape measure protein